MRQFLLAGAAGLLWSGQAAAYFLSGSDVWINEFHYDNAGTDTGEFIELAGLAGTNLGGWQIVLYNGNTPAAASVYDTRGISGIIPDQANGRGTISFAYPVNGLQNGGNDAIALRDNNGVLRHFLSYEGTATGSGGPADGITSTDIGVSQSASAPIGSSLRLVGSGTAYGDFTWAYGASGANPGAINDGQSFGAAPPPPPPPPSVTIAEIQGSGHTSPLNGQSVTTAGIVTAVRNNGFWMQMAQGDGNPNTSDGIFVFTATAPSVATGDAVSVAGSVSEFVPGGNANNLSVTQLTQPTITVQSSGNPVPVVLIDTPPVGVINDNGFATFERDRKGIDFWESFEGMNVTLPAAQVTGPGNNFNEIWAVANGGAASTGMNAQGGITITAADSNPERLQIDDVLTNAGGPILVNTGDTLGDVTGVISYDFGNYELLNTAPLSITSGGLQPETTSLMGGKDYLTVASYNVENLSAALSPQSKFDALGAQIVQALKAPDIIALQEIQDDNGNTNNGVVTSQETLQKLIDAIAAAGGPAYKATWVDPANNQDGGAPGANIRVAYLYNDERVELAAPSARLPGSDGDSAFAASRKPLEARFLFNGEEVVLINNHFASKSGSRPLYGANQPFDNDDEGFNAGVEQRLAQAIFVRSYVESLLAADPSANVVVLGDLNEFSWVQPLLALASNGIDQVLFDLNTLLAEVERYSYIFEGNSQQLDHMLVSAGLFAGALFDIVHLNSDFWNGVSDHDPLLARFFIEAAAVSEPETLALVLAGLALLLGLRWRRIEG
jgi:predicted extracellular nuclease